MIAGESLQKVSLETGVSDYTVKAIKGRIRDEIPDWKKNTSRKMEKLITELLESLQNDLTEGRLSPDRKAIAIGICDKVGLPKVHITVDVNIDFVE